MIAIALCFVAAAVAAQPNEVMRVETPFDTIKWGPDNFAGVTVSIGPSGSGVVVSLGPTAANDFARITARSVGQLLSVTVCEKPALTATVQLPIDGSILLPASGIEQSDLLAEVLRGQVDCEDYLANAR